ncbi:hypothetical protein HU200_011798 [Digitaria exilis]|uniref:F-box domain-containing protein n=1 Tax=Digitaria exilis TaxID=1010633 RepID=A0A835FHB4_9POAL|nr:hypothetical protein HU200_011798 [Digitaria exilis]
MPPPPRPRAPPALPDELVEAILLRSPPDDPARLVHAALVCRRWCRLVSGRSFRRRFRARRPAPMLGFISNDAVGDGGFSARFVRTAASCPPLAARRGWHALDARAGRVLLHHRAAAAAATQGIRLAVWDPLASVQHQHMVDLPSPVLPRRPRSLNAVLLCDDDDPPAEGAFVFRVVLVGTDAEGAFACVYSSSPPEAAAWSEPSQQQHPGDDHVDVVRGALVGDAVYFVCQRRTRVLRYDLATRAITLLHLPPVSHNQRIALTATDGGGLGFARMERYRLGLWSSMDGGGGTMEWTRDREIDLRTLLPVIDLLGFAHGVVLVGTVDGFFSVDQKSDRITKVGDGPGFYNLVPYATFYTHPGQMILV